MATSKYNIEPGQTYGDLTVLERGKPHTDGHVLWCCLCTCGRIVHAFTCCLAGRGACKHPQVWTSIGGGVAAIPLRHGQCIIDEADVAVVSERRWVSRDNRGRPSRSPHFQVVSQVGPCTVVMGRLLLQDQITPEHPLVDHKNGNGLDNRRCNLRPATHADNAYNANATPTCNNKYGYRGVYQRSSGRWEARIRYKHTRINLGTFDSIHDAARAYNAAAIKYHGEFARLNNICEDQ